MNDQNLGTILLHLIINPWIVAWSCININLVTDHGQKVCHGLEVEYLLLEVLLGLGSHVGLFSQAVPELGDLDPRNRDVEHLLQNHFADIEEALISPDVEVLLVKKTWVHNQYFLFLNVVFE